MWVSMLEFNASSKLLFRHDRMGWIATSRKQTQLSWSLPPATATLNWIPWLNVEHHIPIPSTQTLAKVESAHTLRQQAEHTPLSIFGADQNYVYFSINTQLYNNVTNTNSITMLAFNAQTGAPVYTVQIPWTLYSTGSGGSSCSFQPTNGGIIIGIDKHLNHHWFLVKPGAQHGHLRPFQTISPCRTWVGS